MDVLQMRAVIAVDETGSFSKAAELLEITAPTVKSQIDALEFEIGATLFIRSKRGSVATIQGGYLVEQVRPILAAIDAAVDGARALGASRGIALACPQNNPQPLRDEVCAGFIREHPGIPLRYVTFEAYDESFELLADDRANAIFCFLPCAEQFEDPRYSTVLCPGVPPVTYRILGLGNGELAGRSSISKSGILDLRRADGRFAVGLDVSERLLPYVSGAPKISDSYKIINHCLDGGLCLIDNYMAINDGRLVAIPVEDASEQVFIRAKVPFGDAVEKFVRYCASWTA